MNVASLENCKRLYELSGWRATDKYHVLNHRNTWIIGGNPDFENKVLESLAEGRGTFKLDRVYPAYESGYLVRKLPPQVKIHKDYDANPELPEETPAFYYALYNQRGLGIYNFGAETPEDALCLLAIKLFEEGILK